MLKNPCCTRTCPAPLQLPQLQATRSFLEAEGESSPPPMGSIKTPGPPDVSASRWRKEASKLSGDYQMASHSHGRRV